MRRLSPYVTRLLLRTPVTANAVTALMIPAGLFAALALTLPGLAGAAAAVVLAQFQLLLDCCDGEVARWRRTFSPRGVYLDQIAHYSTEAALAAALGIRAAGGWYSIGGWAGLGLLLAVLILLLKAETHLAEVAAARSGRALTSEEAGVHEPSGRRLRLREGARLLPSIRPFQAVEATLLALVATVVDVAAGDLLATRALLLALVVAGVVAVAGHLLSVLRSPQLS